MLDLEAALADVLDVLTGAGLRAYVDPRDVNPPCALVRDQTLTPAFLGAWAVVWQVDLIAGDSGTRAAIGPLSRLLDQLTSVVPIDSATRVDLTLPGVADTLPAYRCLITSTVREDK